MLLPATRNYIVVGPLQPQPFVTSERWRCCSLCFTNCAPSFAIHPDAHIRILQEVINIRGGNGGACLFTTSKLAPVQSRDWRVPLLVESCERLLPFSVYTRPSAMTAGLHCLITCKWGVFFPASVFLLHFVQLSFFFVSS